jgi:hypothetical protein
MHSAGADLGTLKSFGGEPAPAMCQPLEEHYSLPSVQKLRG